MNIINGIGIWSTFVLAVKSVSIPFILTWHNIIRFCSSSEAKRTGSAFFSKLSYYSESENIVSRGFFIAFRSQALATFE